MINISNLSVELEDSQILKNINFDISDSGFLTIVGKSGSGKSVLIKTIIGLIKSFAGKITIDGKINHLHKDKNISMLFQSSALLDSMNVFYNVALPLQEHTHLTNDQIKEKVISTLKFVGLHNIENKVPSQLSGGMKKRVALARAIIQEPKYIFFDEPTTGLDPIIAAEIINLIKSLQNKLGFSAIIITHDIRFLQKLSGQIIMLKDKRIIFNGNIDDFLSSQNHNIKFFIESY
ncbi:MAG: ATP-binding cassette domain-containing protein [Candidatus Cloacimonadota bacterium]|nr:ATP-binding cassette domain-containing protein [Candidatus Cloacimonadota bacterium]